MHLLSAATNRTWSELSEKPSDPGQPPTPADVARSQLEQALNDALMSENLLVLTGLGTSLCIKDDAGNRLAPTMPDLWNAVKTATSGTFDQVLGKVHYAATGSGGNIEALLSRCQMSEKLKSDEAIRCFIEKAEQLIVEKCRFLKPGQALPIHETFLRKVIHRPARLPRTRVFTTNYDLTIETAASNARLIPIDGFSHAHPQEFDGTYFDYDLIYRSTTRDLPSFVPSVFQYYKLHGSLDWERKSTQVVKSPAATAPLIIYPRESKYESSYEQPFLEMMSRFQNGLRQQNLSVVVVGFGFNDSHISQPLLSSVRANVGMRLVVVDPALKDSPSAPAKDIAKLIEAGDSRLTLLAAKFEEAVPLFPTLQYRTDADDHRDRVRKAGEV